MIRFIQGTRSINFFLIANKIRKFWKNYVFNAIKEWLNKNPKDYPDVLQLPVVSAAFSQLKEDSLIRLPEYINPLILHY